MPQKYKISVNKEYQYVQLYNAEIQMNSFFKLATQCSIRPFVSLA